MSELFDNDRGLQIDQVIVGVGEEGMPFISAVHCAAGSDLEMNFGTVSLAAPQAASSRVSRYSRTDRRVLAMASQSTSSDPAAERCLLASAAIRLASTAKAAPSTNPSAMQRRTTVSNSLRSRSQSRKRPCLFLEKVEWSGTSPSRPSRQNHR